ncbi:MAG: vWA domain-containing protein [Planctomycetota bacterium]
MRVALPLLIVVSIACQPQERSDGPTPITADRKLPSPPSYALPSTLRGAELAVSTEGPWTIRSGNGVSTGRGGRPSKRVSGRRRMSKPTGSPPAPKAAPAPGGDGGAEVHFSDSDSDFSRSDAAKSDLSAESDGKALAFEPDDAVDEAIGVGGGAAGAYGDSSSGSKSGLFEDHVEGAAAEAKKLSSSRARSRGRSSAPLRAGSTDDNAKFDDYLKYLSETGAKYPGQFAAIDVHERRFIRVRDTKGRPLPGAEILVVDEVKDVVVGHGRTYGDGRFPVYLAARSKTEDSKPTEGVEGGAGADGGDGGTAKRSDSFIVQVQANGVERRYRWNGDEPEFTIPLDLETKPEETVALDVLFLIDTTGSMQDEMDRIKQSLLAVTKRLRSIEREFDLRYAAVLYRDLGDEYVTKAHPFTEDIAAFDKSLQAVATDGGGDTPESLNQGLAVAVDLADWRQNAAKVVFLIADAPPHLDYVGDTPYDVSLRAALSKGIRIHSVAASGLRDVGSLIFRQIAQYTRGKFIFIEYGENVKASGEAHGVAGTKKANNLDDIIFEQIREEVATFGRDVSTE